MNLITVKEFATLKGLKPSYVYNLVSQKRIKIVKEGRKTLIREDEEILENPFNINDTHVNINDNSDAYITNLQEQIENLTRTNESLHEKVEKLHSKVEHIHKEQKDEIKHVHNASNAQLKMYMELLKSQTENLLSDKKYQEPTNDEHEEEAIIIEHTEEEKEKKRMKPSKFFDIMKAKGYSKKDVKKIIKKALKKNDSRFDIIDGKTIIYKNNFLDL